MKSQLLTALTVSVLSLSTAQAFHTGEYTQGGKKVLNLYADKDNDSIETFDTTGYISSDYSDTFYIRSQYKKTAGATVGTVKLANGNNLTVADWDNGTFNPLTITQVQIEENTTSTITVNSGQTVTIGSISGGMVKLVAEGSLTLNTLEMGSADMSQAGSTSIKNLIVSDDFQHADAAYTQHLAEGSNIAFGTKGKLQFDGNQNSGKDTLITPWKEQPLGITLSAEITLLLSDTIEIQTRDLIVADNIWFRNNANCHFNFAGSEITETTGITLLQADMVENDANADWVINGKSYKATELASVGPVYRFLVTDKGISLQYAAPEPATATLSLLALAGLAARRKRR